MRRDGARTVEYPRLKCPFCGGYRVATTCTRWPERFHKCLEAGCGETFRSWDEGTRPVSKYEDAE